jgi:nucleotide-binding universal stress UspA family protein
VILFGYDGSDEARHAIETAARLLSDRTAVVVDIAEVLYDPEYEAAVPPDPDVPFLRHLDHDAALERAEAGADFARQCGFEATSRGLLAAPIWQGVLDVADEVDASVIVVGSRGLTGVRRFLEGSTSHGLAEHSRRPVLIVPAPGRST